MADGVYPPSKPTPRPGGHPFPPTKSQATGATRLAYRPHPAKAPPSRRGFCCSCCLWFVVLLAVLFVLATVSGEIFYALYRPRRPAFSVTSFRVVAFNISSSGHLTSRFELNVTSRNPNKKLSYLYDPISISVVSGGADIGDGSFPAFSQDAGSVTRLSAAASSSSAGQVLDSATASELRRSSVGGVPVGVEMETKAGVKIGGLKTKRIGMKVRCEGLSVAFPKGKKPAAASSGGDCAVKVRIKIWKWSI
ncbi:NDR1/HIN1-like protein 13 [Curcuma longa]|uniref:NDR1/HIN1-like protein 13 n=1 Tax=Curcuma longa TaxID=136217 RepID=UPI003D9E228F